MTKTVKVNNKEIKNKKPKIKGSKGCTLTLVWQIIVTIALFGLAMAPFMSWLFALILCIFLVLGVVVSTAATLGTAWASEGFRSFWGKVCEAIGTTFSSSTAIVDTLKPHIVWISILMFVLSSVGFIYNLIFYLKHKTNKKAFITSCVFLGIALINMILAMAIFLTYKV